MHLELFDLERGTGQTSAGAVDVNWFQGNTSHLELFAGVFALERGTGLLRQTWYYLNKIFLVVTLLYWFYLIFRYYRPWDWNDMEKKYGTCRVMSTLQNVHYLVLAFTNVVCHVTASQMLGPLRSGALHP